MLYFKGVKYKILKKTSLEVCYSICKTINLDHTFIIRLQAQSHLYNCRNCCMKRVIIPIFFLNMKLKDALKKQFKNFKDRNSISSFN